MGRIRPRFRRRAAAACNKALSGTLPNSDLRWEHDMATMDGRITLVQESRFQLTDEAGVGHLFTLGPWCAAEPAQLVPLAKSQAPVRIKHKPGKDVIGYIAQRIDLRVEAGQ